MHLINLKAWTADEVKAAVEIGIDIKENPERYSTRLKGKTLALLFQKTSTRTRCAGEIGMAQLGGNTIYLDWRTTNFGLADLGDEIHVLSTYADLMVVRLLRHADVVRAAASALVPVMNGCCDRYHPLQALADLQTIQETFGRLEGIRLTYVGVHNNVCNSLIAAGIKVGMEVTVVAPETNPSAVDNQLLDEGRATGLYQTSEDLTAAVKHSDVVYTDTWIDMEFFTDPGFAEEKKRRIEFFQPYQLNAQLLQGLDAKVMHCLPAHRGYEISDELIDDPRSILFTQAENRLHSQKAVLLQLAGEL